MQSNIHESKTCKNCSNQFNVSKQDFEFYSKISPIFNGIKYNIPIPTHCPDCRQQRRLAIGNDEKMYKRKCNCCNKPIISIYSENVQIPVYCSTCWWGDKFDPIEYGKDFDFNKSFFEQVYEINLKVPKNTLLNINSENCDFNNQIFNSKNSYLSFGNTQIENCYYCYASINLHDCIDCWWSANMSNCYECSNNAELYKCIYCYLSAKCSDCIFCKECVGCNFCIMCYGLLNRSYCINNKQYTKEEFEIEMQKILYSFSNMNKAKSEAYAFFETQYQKYMSSLQTENCDGDCVYNSKNGLGYNVVGIEDGKYLYECCYVYDCQGKIYETNTCVASYNILFGKNILEGSSDCIYCIDLINCKECFGCTGLKNKQYCILNKQYTRDEYLSLIPKIIEQMSKNGERGEYFPINHSIFGYNESVSQDYFRLSKEEAINKGYKRQDNEYFVNIPQGINTINSNDLPDSISKLSIEQEKNILNSAIICNMTGKPYRIIKNELEFYKKFNIPLPRKSPDQRHFERMQYRNPRKLFDRICDKCGIQIKSTFNVSRIEKILCEKCYSNLYF